MEYNDSIAFKCLDPFTDVTTLEGNMRHNDDCGFFLTFT